MEGLKKRFLLLVFAFVLIVSFNTNASAAEKIPEVKVALTSQMTLQEAAKVNNTTVEQVQKALGVKGEDYTDKTVGDLSKGKNISTVRENLRKLIIEKKLEDNKNWPIVFTKLALWALIILSSGWLLHKKIVSNKLRTVFLFFVVLVIGFILGSDPNPLGMIKDALYIYGTTGVVFKPRIVVAGAILITILLGSRLFCGWACHLGALQELFYKIPTKKIKLPFAITNTIRLMVFVAMIVAALKYGFDLLGVIDPYQIFNFNMAIPIVITTIIILLAGISIYRPWCTMVCPFGLLAWLAEKGSFIKVRYQGNLCKDCQACQKVCPTGKVSAKREGKNNGECYACGSCIEACPQNALSYSLHKGKQVTKKKDLPSGIL